MTPTEIIAADAKQHGVDPKYAVAAVNHILSTGKAQLMRENNTLLLVVHLGAHAAELHLFTVDTPFTLVKSVLNFINVIKQTQLRRVYGKADNADIVDMLKRLRVDVHLSDLPQYNWMANV